MYRRHPENIMVKKKNIRETSDQQKKIMSYGEMFYNRANQVGAEELQYTFLFSAIKNDKEAE